MNARLKPDYLRKMEQRYMDEFARLRTHIEQEFPPEIKGFSERAWPHLTRLQKFTTELEQFLDENRYIWDEEFDAEPRDKQACSSY